MFDEMERSYRIERTWEDDQGRKYWHSEGVSELTGGPIRSLSEALALHHEGILGSPPEGSQSVSEQILERTYRKQPDGRLTLYRERAVRQDGEEYALDGGSIWAALSEELKSWRQK